MADLPDLDTSQVGFIAYWNAIDQGDAAGIEPSEVTSAGRVSEVTSYDNGVEGAYTLRNDRTARFRVKSDGWFVLWMDRTHNLTQHNGGRDDHDLLFWNSVRYADHGTYDSVGNGVNPTLGNNMLVRGINDLQGQLSNSPGITFNQGDVGLHHFEYGNATNTTVLRTSGGGGDYDMTRQVGTTRYQHLVWIQMASDDGDGYVTATFDGARVDSGQLQYTTGTVAEAIDAIYLSLATNEGQAYTTSADTGPQSSVELGHLIVWG